MKTLITGACKFNEEQIKDLSKLGLEITFLQDEKKSINFKEFEFVICNGLFLYHDISLFKSLKYIQLTSAGLDRVPLDYINSNNIKLFNAKGVYSIPMAEWVICKVLDVYKETYKIYENQKNHIWEKERNIFDLYNKTAVIVGYGSVGKEICKRLIAFGVNVITIDRDNFFELQNVLKKADITIITLPLTNETEGLFDKEKFSIMKNNCILVNVSRGKIINKNDLLKYHNKFLNIILDVFENEPLYPDDEYWKLNNITITPHNSFISESNNNRLFNLIKENLENFIK